MKNDRSIFACLFLLILMLPAPLVLLGLRGDTSMEARSASDYPKLALTSILKPEELQSLSNALEDRMPLRSHLVNFRSLLAHSGFSANPFHQVVIGKNGWLYLAETFESHCTPDEHAIVWNRITEVAEILEECDIKLLLILVPDKATVHPEGIPEWMGETHLANIVMKTALQNGLEESRDWFIDMSPVLEQARSRNQNENLYHKTDTHWNWTGARLFFERLINELQPDLFDPSEIRLAFEKPANFDLDRLSGSAIQRPRKYYFPDRSGIKVVPEQESQYMVVTSARGPANRLIPGRTLIIRDSFWDSYPNIGAAYFQQLTSIHSDHASVRPDFPEMVARSDTFVVEVVERNFCRTMLKTIASEHFLGALSQAIDHKRESSD
ncbi:MAG: hypothetical protein CMJ40_08545 [Phycisphaerae bacterium]|nr:hypothetical protein [Phycisphaerae bacterium]